jgi:hypothetical protein
MHTHDTVETFMVISGKWKLEWESDTGAEHIQTVRKLSLSGFLCGVGDVRIAHDSHRRLRA